MFIESFDLFLSQCILKILTNFVLIYMYIESFDLFLSQYTCILKALTYFCLNILPKLIESVTCY